MLLLEQDEITIDNAPKKEMTISTVAKEPKKTAIEKIKDTAKKAVEVSSGTLERAITKEIDDETKKEIREEWIPHYFRTGDFRIPNKRAKGESFLVDLRLWGWLHPSVRNYFYNQAKEKGLNQPKHFMFIEYLKNNPPRTKQEAEEIPNNINKITKKHPMFKKVEDVLRTKNDKKRKKPNWLKSWWNDTKQLSMDTWRSLTEETNTMNNDDIRTLIKEAFTDKVYGQYPYSHRSGDEEEPKEDYVEEWKRFCMEMVQDKSKERAIAIAKLLVKDVELFEDVLDLAGQNQSVGSEILRKMQKSEEV